MVVLSSVVHLVPLVAEPVVVLSSVVHLVQHVLYSLPWAVVLSAVVLSAVVLSSLIVEVGVPLVGSCNPTPILDGHARGLPYQIKRTACNGKHM